MTVPPPIDPRMLAAEIEASVSEFNRLANLAAQVGVTVEAEVHRQSSPERAASRPILMVRVIAPL